MDIKEFLTYCPTHPEMVFHPEETAFLTPLKSVYGWDVHVFTGLQRFDEHRQLNEIQIKLHDDYGIDIPTRTMDDISKRFLESWLAVHIESIESIHIELKKQGAYVLHIDATEENGSMPLLVLKDGLSGMRLWSAAIPSENKEDLVLVLRFIRERFGPPVAVIRDMGKGVKSAVDEVFPDIYVLICHYHFLRTVGNRLLTKLYLTFQTRVNRTGVKGKLRKVLAVLKKRSEKRASDIRVEELIEKILSYEKGDALGIPFDLPTMTFYERCIEAEPIIHNWINDAAQKNQHDVLSCHVEDILRELHPPPAVRGRIEKEFEALKVRRSWFTSIRTALRYRNGPIPLNTLITFDDAKLEKARSGVARVLHRIDTSLDKMPGNGHDRRLRKILKGVKKSIADNEPHLLAPNVVVGKGKKRMTIQLARTNNSMEQDFRKIRRHYRRIQGNSDVEGRVQREGPGIALMLNLDNPLYIETLYGNRNGIANRFTRLNLESIKNARQLIRREITIVSNRCSPQ